MSLTELCTRSDNLEHVTILVFENNNTKATSLLNKIQERTCLPVRHCNNAEEIIESAKVVESHSVIVVTNNSKHVSKLLDICDVQRVHLKAIYVFDSNTKNMVDNRRIGYFSNVTNLLHQIELDAQPKFNQELLVFCCFDRNQKTIRDLNKEAASFMWTQMLIDVLKHIPKDRTAMEEMILMCQESYRDNPVQLNCIREFSESYEPHHAIQWYTKNCFLYRLLNKALRTEDTDALRMFGPFIVDLCAQLEEQKRLCLCSPTIFTVYRGQTMSEWEINKIKAKVGQLISANAFFSASYNEDVAEIFAECGLTIEDEKGVLLEIEVDTRLRYTIIAPIAHLSEISVENEVLFSLSTVFKIMSVYEEVGKNRWRIQLQATDEGREVIEEYKYFALKDYECPTYEIVFGRLLMYMGQYAKGIKYLTSLVNRLDVGRAPDVVAHAAIICSQSEALYYLGKYEEARECTEKGLILLDKLNMSPTNILYLRCQYHLANALILINKVSQARHILEETLREQQNQFREDHVHIADTLRTIGLIIGNESGYDKSLKVRQEALRIYEKLLPENHHKRIQAMISLAGSFEALGEFRTALDYLYRVLSMQERCLPDEHTLRGITLRSLGIIHQVLDEKDIAFDYFIRAFSIWMFLHPDGHNYTAFCLNKIGEVYCARKQFFEALRCQMHALEMRTKLFKIGTPQPYYSLGRTYLDMGDNVKAIETLHLACDYWKAKSIDSSNKYLNAVESILATAYSHSGEFDKAQEIFERVLFLQKKSNSEQNPDIGYTLHHMASNLGRMNQYDRAIECYKESLNILRNFFSENHSEVLNVCGKMATLESLMKKIQQD